MLALDRAASWKKTKWRNASGRPIDNSDLWDDLLKAKAKVGARTDIEWEKGKSTKVEKEVDRRAKESARTPWRSRDHGFQHGKVARTKLKGIVASLFPASGQIETVRVYRKGASYHGPSQESKIFFEVYSEVQKSYISKHYAYCTFGMEATLHRSHHYHVRFNTDSKHPMIDEVIEEFFPESHDSSHTDAEFHPETR
jgi:hypothetical protein